MKTFGCFFRFAMYLVCIHCILQLSVAVRVCLPPGANVCVAALASWISSAIRVFSRFWTWGCEPTLEGPPFSVPSHSPPLLSPLLYPAPSLLLEVGPLNPAEGLKSTVGSPSGVWGRTPAEIKFVTF